MRNLITNWKTTSAGMAIIITSIVHLVFSVRAKTADEAAWTTALIGVVTGVGLLLAGDGSKSVQAHEETKAALADLQNQVAAVKADTAQVTKPTAP